MLLQKKTKIKSAVALQNLGDRFAQSPPAGQGFQERKFANG